MEDSWVKIAREILFIRFGVEIGSSGGQTIAELLKEIAELKADDGGDPFNVRCSKDMKECARLLGENGISHTTINNLFSQKKPQAKIGKRTRLFFLQYLAWIPRSELSTVRTERLEKLAQELGAAAHNIVLPGVSQPNQDEVFLPNLYNLVANDLIAKHSVQSPEQQAIFANYIFSNLSYANGYHNTAYFLAFRQSTLPNRIIKSFIAILSPAENNLDLFSYVHIVKGSNDVNAIAKTTRGLISHLVPATYFIGATLREDHNYSTNYEMISFEREAFTARAPVLDGLTMAAAAVNQPVIARTVLLRIGDRRTLERKLSDRDFQLTEFPDDETENVIERDLAAVPDGFKHIVRSDGIGVSAVAALVRRGIQNMARADILPTTRFNRSVQCRGALETWGLGPRA